MEKSKLLYYKQLLEQHEFNSAAIPYHELLQTHEWLNKRKDILERDSYCCMRCHNGETIKISKNGKEEYCFVTFPKDVRKYRNNYCIHGSCDHFYIYEPNDLIFTPTHRHSFLHVHHTYYKLDRLPWEYENESLQTLCVHCHLHLHQCETVLVYKLTALGYYEKTQLTCCSRCYGAGILPEFDYYLKGICFRCWGAKYDELISAEIKSKRSQKRADNAFAKYN